MYITITFYVIAINNNIAFSSYTYCFICLVKLDYFKCVGQARFAEKQLQTILFRIVTEL